MMNIRVAIVEDNNIMRYMLKSYFDAHFEVFAFDDGLAFFEWMQNAEPPHLVITDLNMPEMNGFELTASLKNSELFKDIIIIVLSGLEDSQDRIKCLQLGAEDYLIKPFNPEELLIKIQKIIKYRLDYEQTSDLVYKSK